MVSSDIAVAGRCGAVAEGHGRAHLIRAPCGWWRFDGSCLQAQTNALGKTRNWDNGFRQITSSSSRQLNSVEDLRGFKIRVPVTALLTSLFSGFGALPSSISYSELYSALQTHIVEGQENPLAQVSTGKLYEVQKYCARRCAPPDQPAKAVRRWCSSTPAARRSTRA